MYSVLNCLCTVPRVFTRWRSVPYFTAKLYNSHRGHFFHERVQKNHSMNWKEWCVCNITLFCSVLLNGYWSKIWKFCENAENDFSVCDYIGNYTSLGEFFSGSMNIWHFSKCVPSTPAFASLKGMTSCNPHWPANKPRSFKARCRTSASAAAGCFCSAS